MAWPSCLKMSFLCINTSDGNKLKCPKESILSISNEQKMKYFIDLKEVVRTEMINPKLMFFPFATWGKKKKKVVFHWNCCTGMGKPELRQLKAGSDHFYYVIIVIKPGPGSLGGPRFMMKINIYSISESSFAYCIHQEMQTIVPREEQSLTNDI